MIRGPGRPKNGYYLADRTRVPSATTVTGRYKDAGGLLRWAHNEGREGRELYETRDKAGEAGHIAHQWIEDFFHEEPATQFPDAADELIEQASQGFNAFRDWAHQVKPVVLETEMPLVSEEYRFAGTFDCLAEINGERVLLDWKTSNSVYPEYICQLAAYRQLLAERDGDLAPKRALLLRIGKKYADFHYHSYPEKVLDIGWDWFRYARIMYGLDKDLKGLAA